MKTLFKPFQSLTQILHDSADAAFVNPIFGNAHDFLGAQWRNEGDSFIISVPVPGMSKEDLTIHMEGRTLVIATKKQGKSLENSIGSKRNVEHSFVLPDGIDTNSIHAKCRNGLLTINIEKMETTKRPTIIKVAGEEEGSRAFLRKITLWEKIKGRIAARKSGKITSRVKTS